MNKKLKHAKIPCRYKLVKLVPKSMSDLNRELDWEAYGATIFKEVYLTEDDYGLILDALYEQAMEHLENRSYQKSLREVAKKFERI